MTFNALGEVFNRLAY